MGGQQSGSGITPSLLYLCFAFSAVPQHSKLWSKYSLTKYAIPCQLFVIRQDLISFQLCNNKILCDCYRARSMLEKEYARELHQVINLLEKKREVANKRGDKGKLKQIDDSLTRLNEVYCRS